MATAMDNNLAIMKNVTGMPYTSLVAMIHKHYPNIFDLIAWENTCVVQGLGGQKNLVLYLTVANTLGIKDQFLQELASCGHGEHTADAADVTDTYDLQSDPSYTIGFTCNTTRGCVFVEEPDSPGGYEYVGDADNELKVSVAATTEVATQEVATHDVTTQSNMNTSALSGARDNVAAVKETGSDSERATEPAELISDNQRDKCVLDVDTEDNSKVVLDDD